jgi:hypothetical protein
MKVECYWREAIAAPRGLLGLDDMGTAGTLRSPSRLGQARMSEKGDGRQTGAGSRRQASQEH